MGRGADVGAGATRSRATGAAAARGWNRSTAAGVRDTGGVFTTGAESGSGATPSAASVRRCCCSRRVWKVRPLFSCPSRNCRCKSADCWPSCRNATRFSCEFRRASASRPGFAEPIGISEGIAAGDVEALGLPFDFPFPLPPCSWPCSTDSTREVRFSKPVPFEVAECVGVGVGRDREFVVIGGLATVVGVEVEVEIGVDVVGTEGREGGGVATGFGF